MERNCGITRREFIYRGAGVAALAGLGVGGLAGCGGGEGGSQGGPVEIEYWHINTASFGGQTTTDLVARFQEENPDTTVTECFQDSSTQEGLSGAADEIGRSVQGQGCV